MANFTPTRSLLNPKFEGYKLLLLDQDDIVRRYALPYKITQASSYGKSPLTFQEVQSRITHNHLVLSPIKGRGVYVDANHQVIVVDVVDTAAVPSFHVVYELPMSIVAPQIDLVHSEYPSAAFLDETTAFIGDGRGTLYILDIPITGPATLLASFDLVDTDAAISRTSTPFRVHDVTRTSDTTAVALLSSRHYAADNPSAKHPMKYYEFDVWAVRFTLPFETPLESLALDIAWRRRGEDVPMLMTYHCARNTYLLLGSSPYRKTSDPHAHHYEPSSDEIAPIPRAEESLDAEGPPQPTKPYPYSWTQTSDVVTVAFPLPSTVATSQIRVTFSSKTLTVHVTTPPVVESFIIPRYSAKQLWDGIRPSTSFWTWDREGEHEFGILSVHLDKQNEGTRWTHVFAASGNPSAEPGDEDSDVPETLDPSELYAIREALEKYTTALREGEDASGLGLGCGLPTLAQGEMDEEVDSSVGRLAFVTWVGEDGSSPAWSSGTHDSAFNVLSTPLPGSGMGPLSLVVKNGLDGTRHVLSDDPTRGGLPEWKHENTFSALAFVLASKRDTRFTYHASDMIFAFENGSQDRGGNVYVYRSSSSKELWAKQSVLTVGQGDAGSLLGIGTITSTSEGGNTIVCLCENELVILYNVH